MPLDDVTGVRIAQDEQANQRHDECEIHHKSCAPLVRHPATQRPEHRSRQGVEPGEETRCRQLQPIGTDIVARQEAGQRDEGAEDEEVIGRKPPDLRVFQRFQLHQGRGQGALVRTALRQPVQGRPW